MMLSACGQESSIKNPDGIWTKVELEELNFIVSEFDKILMTEYKTKSIKQAYLGYSSYVFQNNATPILDGMEKLSADLKKFVVFEKIWWKYTRQNSNHFNLKGQSSYLKYLSELGESSDFINHYADQIDATSDIQPSVVAGFAKNIGSIDLTNKNNRLIFAIHYLTIINR